MGHRPPATLGAALLVLTLAGCQAGYVWKQAVGQWALSCRQVPLDDPDLRARLTARRLERLDWVPRILRFARDDLGLEPGDSYTTFLDTRGAAISHVVVASHPRALAPHLWCFPFVGCVSYKGFFDRSDAEHEAEGLRAAGEDVGIYEVEAFSTLGWFRDPVLSTMLDRDLPDLIELLIHETVHRTLYVPDHTTFNESLATLVAREGTKRFLDRNPSAATPDERELWLLRHRVGEADARLLRRVTADLDGLYRSERSDAAVLARKEEVLATTRRARSILYGTEVEIPASNADLLASLSYHDLVPALQDRMRQLGGLPRALMAYFQEMLERGDPLPEPFRPPGEREPLAEPAPVAEPPE